jgi:DNA-binding transcriptional LysR family regulator
LDIQLFKTFLSIYRNESFQDTADELGYAQSTITNQMQNLEAELGLILIERSRKIRLTQAGEIFKTYAEQMLAVYENMLEAVGELSDESKGLVKLGTAEPFASYFLPKILCSYGERYPRIDIQLTVHESFILNEKVIEGKLNFAICPFTLSNSNTVFEPMLISPILLAIPEKHPLMQKEKIYFRDLRYERILVNKTKSAFYKNMVQMLNEYGASPFTLVEIVNSHLPIHFVQKEYGLSFIVDILADQTIPGVAIRRIEDCGLTSTFGIVKKKDRRLITPAAHSLEAYIKKYIEDYLSKSGKGEV